jgi:hypothetical protein
VADASSCLRASAAAAEAVDDAVGSLDKRLMMSMMSSTHAAADEGGAADAALNLDKSCCPQVDHTCTRSLAPIPSIASDNAAHAAGRSAALAA